MGRVPLTGNMHAIDTDNARWCITVARVGRLRRLYGVTLKQPNHGHPIQRTDTRPEIRSREGLRDTERDPQSRGQRDERSRRRARTVVADHHHGADRDEPPRRKPRLPLAGLRLAPTITDRLTHEENILYLMIELDQALARKAPRWLRNRWTPRGDGWQAYWRSYCRSSRGRDGAAVTATLRVPLTVGICTLSISIMHNGD